jgi:serine-type D-Ala-D-Ala carboxypeptidase/endopeptidase (penicillin-binding protein 4)
MIGPTFRSATAGLIALATASCAPLLATRPGTGGPAATTPLQAELDAIFGAEWIDHAHWGILVRSLDSGETIYTRNADRLFVPASVVKLLTGAAMLETVGPDFRYRTIISTSGTIRGNVLDGSLVVTGSGDPTFSSRFHADPRDVFRAWADSLRSHGITRISGSIIGVDTAFVGPTLGSGWAWDDLMAGYAAEFGALQFNENVVELDIFPNRNPPQPAVIVVTPATQSIRVFNDTRTMPDGSNTALRIVRDEFGTGIVARGEIAADADPVRRSVSAGTPAAFLIALLRETLREAGVVVEGQPVLFGELEPYDTSVRGAMPLFEYRSPPLSEILPRMLKPSQNLIAETMLRTVGREMVGVGSAEGGVAVVDSLLTAWDLDVGSYRMADGSGLSRYNLLSPSLVVALLARMDRSAHRELWIQSLPLGGRDGTLLSRMREPPLIERVQAKTGTLSGVRSLSGYLTTQRGERVVFSMIVNNHTLAAADVDRLVDSALERIATFR